MRGLMVWLAGFLPLVLVAEVVFLYPDGLELPVSPKAIASDFSLLTGESVRLCPYEGRSSFGLAFSSGAEGVRGAVGRGGSDAVWVVFDGPSTVEDCPELLFAGYCRLKGLAKGRMVAMGLNRPARYSWNDSYRDLLPNLTRVALAAGVEVCPAGFAWWQTVKDSRELIKGDREVVWTHALALALTLGRALPEELPAPGSFRQKAPSYARSVGKALKRSKEIAWSKGRPYQTVRLSSLVRTNFVVYVSPGRFEQALLPAVTNRLARMGLGYSVTNEAGAATLVFGRVDSPAPLPPEAICFARPLSTADRPDEMLTWLERYLFAAHAKARARRQVFIPIQLACAEWLRADPSCRPNSGGLPTPEAADAYAAMIVAAATGSCEAPREPLAKTALETLLSLATLRANPNTLILDTTPTNWFVRLARQPDHPVHLYAATPGGDTCARATLRPDTYATPARLPVPPGPVLLTTQSDDPAADHLLLLRGPRPTDP